MGRPGIAARLTPSAPDPGRRRRVLLRVLLSLLVLAGVLLLVDLDAARDGLSRVRILPWLAAVAAFLGLHAVSALKWRFMLSLGGARLPARHALTCHAAGLFANLCMPSLIGGDVLRAGLALPLVRRRTALVVGSVVDRVADLSALLTVALAGLVAVPWAQDVVSAKQAIPIVGGLLALGAVCGLVGLRILLRRSAARRLPRKIVRRVIEVRGALRTMRRKPGRSLCGWSACVAIQTGFVLVNVQLGALVGLDLDLGLWFLLWPLAKIAAMLPVSFGGLGVREAAFAALVAPFGPESLAVAQSLVWQSVLIAGGLAAGGFWVLSPGRVTVRPAA